MIVFWNYVLFFKGKDYVVFNYNVVYFEEFFFFLMFYLVYIVLVCNFFVVLVDFFKDWELVNVKYCVKVNKSKNKCYNICKVF